MVPSERDRQVFRRLDYTTAATTLDPIVGLFRWQERPEHSNPSAIQYGNNKRPRGKKIMSTSVLVRRRCLVQTNRKIRRSNAVERGMASSRNRASFASKVAIISSFRSCTRIRHGVLQWRESDRIGRRRRKTTTKCNDNNNNNNDCTKTCRNLPKLGLPTLFSRGHCTGLYDENNVSDGRVRCSWRKTSPRSGNYIGTFHPTDL
jgi:hypothetical protein